MKRKVFLMVLALTFVFNMTTAYAKTSQYVNDQSVSGGWDEKTGYFSTVRDYNKSMQEKFYVNAQSDVNHTGQKEETIINGTTNYRAHGWTTWVGVYHYTRARMEDIFLWFEPIILTDSGRVWGYDNTEAISPWWAITQSTPGSARTYYGH